MTKIQVLKNDTYNNENALPKTATDRSTGYDIVATSDPEIVGEKTDYGYKRIDYIQYRTNLYVAVKPDHGPHFGFGYELIDYDILAFPRSSVSKYNLILANCIGLIDSDYRGEVLLRFKYMWQPEDIDLQVGKPNLEKIYKKGDKICQLKITKVEHAEFCLVDKLDSTQRGEGGFGSTDKNIQTNEVSDNIVKNYNKNPITTPIKKYSEKVKERESNLSYE